MQPIRSPVFRPLLVCLAAMAVSAACSSPSSGGEPLRISKNGRFLVRGDIGREDGRPFFWLGDTAWELFHRLGKADTEHYLSTRARQGFNVVQCVLLSEFGGLTVPTPEGHVPLVQLDPTRPNEAYFKHVDWVVDKASELGIYLAILPTWGSYVQDSKTARIDHGPLFNESNAEAYGRFLGRRYRDRWNIVWVLGGDRAPTGFKKVWNAMAAGLRAGDGGRHLMTYHVNGAHCSSEYWHAARWLDFNMIQSGHALGPFSNNYDFIRVAYHKKPVKPVIDGEALYEDMPIGFVPSNGRAGAHHIRVNAYWAVFAGACGHTYGANGVFQMSTDHDAREFWAASTWRDALRFEGARQLRHLKHLILSRPFLTRIPDQNLLDPAPVRGAAHPQSTRDGTPGKRDATYLMVYFPYVTWTNKIDTRVIASARLRAWWFDPRTGKAIPLGESANRGTWNLEWKTRLPPGGGGPDWVLVIDAAESNYGPPGIPISRSP